MRVAAKPPKQRKPFKSKMTTKDFIKRTNKKKEKT